MPCFSLKQENLFLLPLFSQQYTRNIQGCLVFIYFPKAVSLFQKEATRKYIIVFFLCEGLKMPTFFKGPHNSSEAVLSILCLISTGVKRANLQTSARISGMLCTEWHLSPCNYHCKNFLCIQCHHLSESHLATWILGHVQNKSEDASALVAHRTADLNGEQDIFSPLLNRNSGFFSNSFFISCSDVQCIYLIIIYVFNKSHQHWYLLSIASLQKPRVKTLNIPGVHMRTHTHIFLIS